MYSVQCTQYNVGCAMYMYIVHIKLYSHCTMYIVHIILNLHCTMYILYCLLYYITQLGTIYKYCTMCKKVVHCKFGIVYVTALVIARVLYISQS